jgi:hypothetical protein
MSNNTSSNNTNLKKQINFAIFWTALVGCYIFIEWIFNQHFLQVMSSDNIPVNSFEKTILIGKITLSIGLNLIIKGIYQYKQWWKFGAGVTAIFSLISLLYMQSVDAFPLELQYASYYGKIMKKNVVSLSDKDKILDIKDDNKWYVKPILLSHFMFTLDNRKWFEYQNRVAEPTNREVTAFVKNKRKNFESYKKAEDARKLLDKSWNDVLAEKAKYEAVRYSKAKRPEKKAALDIFREKTGLEPSTTQEEFYKANSKEYHRALTAQIFSGFPDGNLAPIYVKDLAQNLTEEQFYNYVENKAKEIRANLTPSMREIRDARSAPEIVKTLALPPMIISFSIISILLNILILISMWVKIFGKSYNIANEVIIPIYFALTLFIIAIGIVIKPPLTSYYSYWNEQEQNMTNKYPELAAFWKIGLKLESVLCITDKPPSISNLITETIYHKRNK